MLLVFLEGLPAWFATRQKPLALAHIGEHNTAYLRRWLCLAPRHKRAIQKMLRIVHRRITLTAISQSERLGNFPLGVWGVVLAICVAPGFVNPCSSRQTFQLLVGIDEKPVTAFHHRVRCFVQMQHLHVFVEQGHAEIQPIMRCQQRDAFCTRAVSSRIINPKLRETCPAPSNFIHNTSS